MNFYSARQVATYNVNGRTPPPDMDVSGWLVLDPLPDIVAVAFQEVVPLSASNVVIGVFSAYRRSSRACFVTSADEHFFNPPFFFQELQLHMTGASLEASAAWDALTGTILNSREALKDRTACDLYVKVCSTCTLVPHRSHFAVICTSKRDS